MINFLIGQFSSIKQKSIVQHFADRKSFFDWLCGLLVVGWVVSSLMGRVNGVVIGWVFFF